MTSVILASGDLRIDLPLQLRIGIGWQPGLLAVEPDLDISAFPLDRFDRLPESEFMVFYNNLQSPDSALQYSGDPTYIRESSQDQKTMELDFTQVDPRVQSLLLVVTLHEAAEYSHHFGLVARAYIRLLDPVTQQEILRYSLDDDFSGETAIQVARFQRDGNQWQLTALGIPQAGGLKAFVAQYN
jgi:tellurium resistance protein TerD